MDIKDRDLKIFEIAQNRVLSGDLEPKDRKQFLAELETLNDICLELALELSGIDLVRSLEATALRSKN